MTFFEYVSINCLERDAEGKFRIYEEVQYKKSKENSIKRSFLICITAQKLLGR